MTIQRIVIRHGGGPAPGCLEKGCSGSNWISYWRRNFVSDGPEKKLSHHVFVGLLLGCHSYVAHPPLSSGCGVGQVEFFFLSGGTNLPRDRAIYIISFLLLRSDRNTSLMCYFSQIRELRCRFGPDQVSGPVPRILLTSGFSFLRTKQIKKLWFWLQLRLFVTHISPSHSVTWLQH